MKSGIRFRTKWYKGIGFKISVTILLMNLTMVLILSLLFFRHTESQFEAELRNSGIYVTKTLSQQIAAPFLYEDRYALYKHLATFKEEEKGTMVVESIMEYAAIYDHDNKLLAYVGEGKHTEGFESEGVPELSGRDVVILPKSREIFEVIAPVMVNEVPIGKVRVGISRAYHLEKMGQLYKRLWVAAALLTIFGTLIILLITRRFILPLFYVVLGAKKIGEGNWGAQIEVKTRDEIGELAKTFNEMSMKTHEAFERAQKTQEKLIQSEKLNAIGKFSANLAHKLKNPLTSIKLSIQAMGEPGASITLDADEREVVLNDIRRMDEIVSGFLAYGAPGQLKLTPVDINDFLRGVTAKLESWVDLVQVRFRFFLAEDLPMVLVDTRRMEEAMENLCVNAIYAVSQGGEIRIRTSKNGSGKGVRVDVEDNGDGIDEKIRDHLFEPFYTTREDGSGLGLSIVYQIVKDHGGEIMVKSEKGKGTVFSISLPLEG